MPITLTTASAHQIPPDIKERAMKWLFTTESVTQPTAPFTLRWMSANGTNVTPGTEITGDSYTRESFSFPDAGMSITPRARYGSDIVCDPFDTTNSKTVTGFEYWDSSGTPVRIAKISQASFSLSAGDHLRIEQPDLQLGQSGHADNCLVNAVAYEVINFITGRAGAARPGTSSFSVRLVKKNTASASSSGDPFDDVADDLYADATDVHFTVSNISDAIYAVNDADIEFPGISSTEGRIVWAWEVFDSGDARMAFGQLVSPFTVYPGKTFKIPAGELKLVMQ